MPTEAERLLKLEIRYEHLAAMREKEQKEFKDFKSADAAELDELRGKLVKIEKQLERAEWWGRGVLYTTLGLAGVVTQLNHVAAWVKKL